jgi:hypothetical protein
MSKILCGAVGIAFCILMIYIVVCFLCGEVLPLSAFGV